MFAVTALILRAGAGAEVEIAARDRPATCAIVTAAEPTEAVRYAAEELRDHLARSTGVTLPIVRAGESSAKSSIFVGPGAADENDTLSAGLGTDGYRIVAKSPNLHICGSGERGALYGVYGFLEKFVGCGWYASWHSVVPKRDRIAVPDALDLVEKPVFDMREPYWWDLLEHPEFAARLKVNSRSFRKEAARTPKKMGGEPFRFGGGLGLCHTFEILMPAKEFFAKHPEYYCFIDGKRRGEWEQLCLTNPDVLRIVTERLLERIRKEPDAGFFGVSQNDNRSYCQCEKCAAVDAEEGSHAGTVIRFVNAVAERVEREFPNVKIETLAYQYSRKPPKTRPRKNVVPCLCSIECGFAVPLKESTFSHDISFCRDLAGWSRVCDQLFIWDYTTDFTHYPKPFANVKVLQDNIRLFRDSGVRCLFEQGGCQGRHADFAELKTWLLAKWMWNPELPMKPLLDEFFTGYYGAGAPYVRAYFEELHDRQQAWTKAVRGRSMRIYDDCRNPALPEEFLWKAAALWRTAEQAVANDPACSYNVRMGSFSVDYAICEQLPDHDERLVPIAKSLLTRMDEAKDICLSENSNRHKFRMRRWQRIVKGVPKPLPEDPLDAQTEFAPLEADAEALFARKGEIRFDGYAGRTTLTNFPVLVKLRADEMAGFREDGMTAFLFTDADGRVLPHDIDSTSADETRVWVSVPRLTKEAKVIVHWAKREDVKSVPMPNARAVWKSAGYLGVYHLNGPDKDGLWPDSAGRRHAKPFSSALKTASGDSPVGGTFYRVPEAEWKATPGGAGLFVPGELAGSIRLDGKLTVSAWSANTPFGQKHYGERLFSFVDTPLDGIDLCAGYADLWYGWMGGSNKVTIPEAERGCWHHLALTADGTGGRYYIDGTPTAKMEKSLNWGVRPCAPENPIYGYAIGSMRHGAYGCCGGLDELRFSASVRSEDWLRAEADTVRNPAFCSRLVPAQPADAGNALDPLVSLFINSTSLLPGDAHCISAMRRLNRDYGLRRFIFDPPGLRRPLGNADHALHVKIGESFKAAKEAMPGCEICWFVRPVLCWSAKQEGQHIMDADGNVSSGLCPLDDAANEPYYDNIRTVAKIADIPMYLIEDDLNLSGHPGLKNRHGGCFCPLHLAALEKKVGRRYTAKELGAIFDAPTKENETVRIAFADVSRDSLARFCRKVRAAIDSVSPKARTMLFQSAQVDIDGDTTEADARALAGTTRPSVRVYGAAYFCQNVPEVLPMVTAHTFYTMQHLPDDIEKFYEADCFPQSRFYNSTLFYLSEIGAAFMAGADDLLMFTARSADDPFADTAYFDMIRANRPRFAALKAFGRRSSVVGVRAVYDAQVNRLYRERGSKMLDESARLLAKFGFPMTTKPSGATVLFGETAHRLSETQLKEMFKGAVLVDSTAALRLTERGFGGWLGCSVKYAEDELEFARSRVLPVAGSRVNGLNPYDYHILEPVTPVPGWDMKMDYVRITPGTSSETWVRYEDTEGRTVAPSFVVSKNPLGGTTAVMSFAVKDNFREWLYSPEMQDVWRNFFDRATGGALDVTATRTPSTWLAARVSDDGRKLLVMVNNLAGEPRSDVALEFSKKWRGGQVEQLQMDGTWRPVGTASDAFRPEDGFTYAAMTPEFFKVTRR